MMPELSIETTVDSDKLLQLLKERIKVPHNEFDESLKQHLAEAIQVVSDLTGMNEATDQRFVGLVLTRAMYAYNDQAEYFIMNYRSELNDLAIKAGGTIDAEPGESEA